MTKYFVSCAPYFRNCASIIWSSYLYIFRHTSSYRQVFFYIVMLIFISIFILIFGVNWGAMAKNGPKWQKVIPIALHISIWSEFLVYSDVICIFFYFKILIFQVVREVKGQKMTQMDKKFSLSHSVSQEPYLIWLWFLVHMYKMMISPAIFFIFSKLWFCLFFGGWDKREENGP